MKRLAIDLRELRRPGTGIGRWTKNFLSVRDVLAADVEVLGIGAWTEGVTAAIPGPSIPWTGMNLNGPLKRENVGLWLSPYFKIIPGLNVPSIATVHDTIPARTLMGPITYTPRLHYSIRNAVRVATVSYESKRELIEDHGVRSEKIVLARNSVGPHFSPHMKRGDLDFLRGLGIHSREYLMAVIDDRPHKNLATLETAFGGVGRMPLLIVGTGRTNLPDPLRRIAGISDDELAVLYRHARAVLHPALEEGFGLPALEAMASGSPLILSDIPTMREIAGEGALYVSPTDVEGWRSTVDEAAVDPASLARAEQFRAERTYAQLWETVLELLSASNRS